MNSLPCSGLYTIYAVCKAKNIEFLSKKHYNNMAGIRRQQWQMYL